MIKFFRRIDVTSGAGTETDSGEITTAKEEKLTDAVPDLDFDGYKFRTIEQQKETYFLFYEEETGDVISDAIHKRNSTVEERFNISFVETVQMYYTDIMQQVINSVMSGTDAYDLVLGQMFYSAQKQQKVSSMTGIRCRMLILRNHGIQSPFRIPASGIKCI